MLFHSVEFALFLPLVLLGYYGLRGWTARKAWLAAASFVFYASWYPPYTLLLLVFAGVNFALGRWIEKLTGPGARRAVVTLGIVFDLGLLGFYKYAGFLAATIWSAVGGGDPPFCDVILPIGISFYTFESLCYLVDVHRGQPACRNPLDFTLFLSFFPHLVAGPIVRPGVFLPSLAAPPRVDRTQVLAGLARVAQGLVKKLLLADVAGVYVDMVWGRPGEMPPLGGHPAGNVLLAMYAYTFQIYFDFSGYTDIALGLARLFGLVLPENFARPYGAQNPRQFWQRWHMSLSTWLRDYLYIPLGGNRRGRARTYVNLFLTMLLGGLWHGAAWGFVFWGAYHGAWLLGQRILALRRPASPGRLAAAMRRLVTFHLVVVGWVLFRMPSLVDGWRFLRGLGRFAYEPSRPGSLALAVVVTGIALHASPAATAIRRRFVTLPSFAQGLAYGLAFVVAFLFAPAGARYIYFQF